jgi:hypothetical protein
MTSPHNHAHKKFIHVLVFSALVMFVLGVAPALARGGQSQNSGWRTTIYPIYGWLPIFGADVRLPEVPPDGGGGPITPEGSVSSNFNGAAFAGALVENKWFQFDANVLWAGMTASKDLPNLRVNLDTILGAAHAGVRVAPSLFATVGVRRVALDLRATAFEFDEVRWKPGGWEGLIGANYTPQVSPHLRILLRADFGGLGTDLVSTTSANGSLEWEALPHFVLTFGYGYLGLKADGEILSRPIHLKQTLHGPIIGIGFTF